MWFLWIFGDNIEDKLGHFRFIAFYLLCGIIASSVHVFFNIQSKVPCVGASGAIAGVLGAYMITFPRARVVTIVPLFVFIQVMELPAIVVLGFWFVIQFFNWCSNYHGINFRCRCCMVGTYRRFCGRGNNTVHHAHILCEKTS
jgi:membrane associated rhomboid family serine protease